MILDNFKTFVYGARYVVFPREGNYNRAQCNEKLKFIEFLVTTSGVRAIFCQGAVNHLPKNSRKLQISTKQSKRNEGHIMH